MTPGTSSVVGVVPAAGASRRFGSAKLLHEIDGEPLLERTLRSLLDAGLARVVLVAAPGREFAPVPLTRDRRVTTVINAHPDRGMFSSILAGMAALEAEESALILPADMPFVRSATVTVLMSAHLATGQTIVAAHEGRRGHPLVIAAPVCRAVLGQADAPNLKAALVCVGVVVQAVDVDDAGVLRDVDEPGDLP